MRITIEIDDDLLRRARSRAAAEGVSRQHIIEKALRAYLSRKQNVKGYLFRWKTDSGKLQPGVNLEDRNSLFNLMDGLD